MANLKAGDLRHRITIQQLSLVTNGEATDETWANFVADVPARVRPLSGREVAAVGTEMAGKTRAFEIRYAKSVGVTEAMRVVHDGMTFNILSITPDETLRDHVVILAEAGIRG
jgi:SPP1 family predicted phage head-tail adaptor